MPQQVHESITQDEQTVLGILSEGGSVAPIGRWEQPVKSLAAKGLAKIDDPANSSITEKGRSALVDEDDSQFEAIAKHLIEASKTHVGIQNFIEEAAKNLKSAAIASAKVTGDSPQAAVEKWGRVLIDTALGLLP